ncbi:MAG: hypothetical protein QHH06_14085 [Clostridiales bacterium]|nr:hypothetical protein [Eubacteriales bacterium]MDH7567573.1 hypothetical protein [Clostridiales bacterium]
MNNDELLVVIKDMFESSMEKMEKRFDEKLEGIKIHTGTLVEKLEKDIKAVAEGQEALTRRADSIENRLERIEQKVDHLDMRVDILEKKTDSIEKNMKVVTDYVIGVDAKLNEHDIILKRVK